MTIKAQITSKLIEAKSFLSANLVEKAQETYLGILDLDSNNYEANNYLGLINAQRGLFNEAAAFFKKASELNPLSSSTLYNAANAYQIIGKLDIAIDLYKKSIQINPNDPDSHNNCGIIFHELKRYPEALASFENAIKINPHIPEIFNNQGVTQLAERQRDLALKSYDQAILLRPNYAEAYNNRSIVHRQLMQFDKALLDLNRALEFNPNYSEAHNNLGNIYQDIKDYQNALRHFNQAIAINPNNAEALFNKANALLTLNDCVAATTLFQQAFALNPKLDNIEGYMLHANMRVCDWKNFDEITVSLIEKCERGEKVLPIFSNLAFSDSPDFHLKSAMNFLKSEALDGESPTIPFIRAGEKIKVAYFSADFHNHATTHLMAGLFEAHDKDKFEIYAFSFGPNEQDSMRQRLESAFDKFIDVRNLSDSAVVELSRSHHIDIAIDLKGYTQDCRPKIFQLRAAPIQINYLGYPGTMGAPFIDYIVADPILVTKTNRKFFSEKIIYLPNTYQANDNQRVISNNIFCRKDAGIPEDAFVFCCFNNNFKITPECFDSWMRILLAVEGSILWLYEGHPEVARNLRNSASQKGIAPQRLVFAPSLPAPEHLARHKLANLFLDTFPYNAHTTASDALWAGLPVVTMQGESFVSRVAASLLNAIELQELITINRFGYENLAIKLATSPAALSAIKDKLMAKRLSSPLFDTQLFARHIERAYEMVYKRNLAGLMPEDTIVSKNAYIP